MPSVKTIAIAFIIMFALAFGGFLLGRFTGSVDYNKIKAQLSATKDAYRKVEKQNIELGKRVKEIEDAKERYANRIDAIYQQAEKELAGTKDPIKRIEIENKAIGGYVENLFAYFFPQ